MTKTFTKHVVRLSLLAGLLLTLSGAFAQQLVGGRVTSETGEGLPGVSIAVKGSSNGTTTDADGNFSLQASAEDVLVFSYIGYEAQEVRVGSQTQFAITLKTDLAALEEIVVIGYGTQRRQDVTSAVAQVKPEEFIPGAVRNAGELLRGKVAGLTLSTPSGDPEAGVEILLRGTTSIYGSSSPLVLIDGFPGSLNAISPADIETVDVLKDASASAIYGTRGKNGVILITTKRANPNEVVIEYSGYIATETFLRKADFMSASQVRDQIEEGTIDPAYDLGGNTNWQDEITAKPFNHFHNISMRGGSERTQYVANASYQDVQGMFINSGNEEFKIRMDVSHWILKDKVKVNMNVLKGIQSYGNFNSGIYRQALIRNPTDDVKNTSGSWQERSLFQYENPVGLLEEQIYDNKQQWTWLTGSASYFPVENLELKITGSQHQWSENIGTYQTKQHVSTTQRGMNGVAYIGNGETTENFLDLTADYAKTFGDHRVSALLGYSYIDWANSGSSMTNFDFPVDNFSYHSIELGQAIYEKRAGSGIDSYKSDWKLIGFFARVGYGFKDKYNIQAIIRREGSSRFGDNNKWGFFPSVSAGWTISKETFMENVDVVSNLKLRVGYGLTGSVSNPSYQALTRYQFSATQFYFNGTSWVSILSPVGNPNPDLGWETNKELNVGIDFGFLSNRITGTIDYYDRKLEDLYFSYPVPVPPNLVGTTFANAGSMSNQGIEIGLTGAVVEKGKFTWTSNINYSRNTNKLVSLSNDQFKTVNDFFYDGYTGDPIQMSTHKVQEGKPVGSFFGYKSIGLQEVPGEPGFGEWVIEGADGEPKLLTAATDADRQILGNGLPKWYLSWNNYFKFGPFDASVSMRGAFDYQVLNFQRMFYENPTIIYNKLATAYDKIDGLTLNSPQAYVSHYVEDADFWKIDNVTIGYTVSPDIKAFRSARVYVSGSNLAVLTKYKGIDPEVPRTGLAPGNDNRDKYPTTRTFSLGINLTF